LGQLQTKKVFKNTRFYDLNGDFEAIYYRPGWVSSNQIQIGEKSPRGTSKNYEKNRKKTLRCDSQ